MKSLPVFIFLQAALAVASAPLLAWDESEHRALADSALEKVLAECGVARRDNMVFALPGGATIALDAALWQKKTFGEICAASCEKDGARARYHRRARSILEQLQPLSAAMIDAAWQKHGLKNAALGAATWPLIEPAELSRQNVVANYLLHHLLALRYAALAGQQKNAEALRYALIYEAMAQGYLSDTFSAGHILVPMSDALSGRHRINNKQAHDFFGSEGLYVIDARGNAWRTFGDKLLHWDGPTHRFVMEAAKASLRECFVIFYASTGKDAVPEPLTKWWESVSPDVHKETMVSQAVASQDGAKYFTTASLPTLLLLPMPVSATWSMRSEAKDEHGIHSRKHYPQLREAGYYDATLKGLDREFLYARNAIPPSMLLNALNGQNVKALIQKNSDLASVHFVQDRNFPPSFIGPLLHVGAGMAWKEGERNSGASLGVGYGFLDELLVLEKISWEIAWMPAFHDRQRLLATAFGAGLKLSKAVALHGEAGYAWGVSSALKSRGWKFALGLDAPTLPLGFTYAGVTVRIKYQWLRLEPMLRGVLLELILH